MQTRKGFTLIEVLVVVAIITMLVAILIPSLTRAKELSRRVVCASNQHQLVVGVLSYAPAFRGVLPYRHEPETWLFALPYAWDDALMVKPARRYWGGSMKVVGCPSHRGVYVTAQAVYAGATNHVDDWLCSTLYLAGLGDAKMNYNGTWYEKRPSAANVHTHLNKPYQIVFADWNMWSDEGWAFVNHPKVLASSVFGDFWGSNGKQTRESTIASIAGGNRAYADGHVDWANPNQMNADGTSLTRPRAGGVASGRYSHRSPDPAPGRRPYYW
jgi:prepilin-type N-terminal cleavage/methylation domain-containing protein/prepilin-type processing-associated H-X9-DG protein